MRIVLSSVVGFVIGLSVLSGTARAENPYRLEVFGSVGVAEEFVIFGPSQTALNIGGGVGVRPFSADRSRLLRMLGAEFEANTTRSSGGGVGYFTGNLLLHASLANAEPYFLLGGGVAHSGVSHRAGDVGFGVKLYVTPHLSVRPEFRVLATDYLGNFVRGSVAVGYHF